MLLNESFSSLDKNEINRLIFFEDKELIGESIKIIRKFQEKNKKILELEKKAYYDNLTGLLNRHGLEYKIKLNYSNNEGISIIVFDVEKLKFINEYYGTISGDKLIKATADILKKCFRFNNDIGREDDIICRYGGDEFIVIIDELPKEIINKRLKKIKNEIFKFNNKSNLNLNLHMYYLNDYKIQDYKIATNEGFIKAKMNMKDFGV